MAGAARAARSTRRDSHGRGSGAWFGSSSIRLIHEPPDHEANESPDKH